MTLLERTTELDQLDVHYRQAATGQGRLVFVAGEMGIGKSALIDAFAARLAPEARLTVISCDGVAMPAPLGPLFDVAQQLGPEVERLLAEQAPRATIFRAVESAVKALPGVPVVVLEDAHWADEASLELLRFLGRRIGSLHSLFIVTYRNDELSPNHPLRRVLGDLATVSTTQRIVLSPLSVEAISTLAIESSVDADELHAYTGGNPFFVIEVLAARTRVPISLQDAILGRASRLTAESREVVDAAAALGPIVDPELLAEVMGRPIEAAIDEGLAVGLFQPDERMVVFRHVAVQSAIVDALSAARELALHRRILTCIADHPTHGRDVARVAFHAEAARDRDAVLTYAMAAATEAAAYQSHREAAEQYARILRFADELPAERRAGILEARAYECHLTGDVDTAVKNQLAATVLWESVGDILKLGDSLRKLSRYAWFAGKGLDANRDARRALDLLEAFPSTRELAMACSHLATMRGLAGDAEEAVIFGNRAIALASDLGDVPTLVHALTTNGTIRLEWNDEGGRPLVEQALALAREANLEEDIGRALEHLTWIALIQRDPLRAERYLVEGLAYASDHDLAAREFLLHADRAALRVQQCDWAAVHSDVVNLLQQKSTPAAARIIALVALGLVNIRTGVTRGNELDEALELATKIDEMQYLALVRSARAEAAWLAGNLELVAEEASAAFDDNLRNRNPWIAGEVALWLHRSGLTEVDRPGIADQYALEIAGNWQAAAAGWEARGLPLEAARARTVATNESDLRLAHSTFDMLGARPDALRTARRLRALGFRGIPRGPHLATRSHFGDLTARELEVLALLATGNSNSEIARQLYLSPRTVDHHVSAILAKLNVSSRLGAVDRARQAGLLEN